MRLKLLTNKYYISMKKLYKSFHIVLTYLKKNSGTQDSSPLIEISPINHCAINYEKWLHLPIQ